MKLKKTIKFSLSGYKKPLLIYYAILCACLIAGTLLARLNVEHNVRIGGLETTTVIFLFVFGLSSFRSELFLYLQNGISRKTACLSYFITSAIVTFFMALLESICYTIMGKCTNFESAFLQIYRGYANRSFLFIALGTFGWCFMFYLASSIVGYCIAALYYRMNKGLKLSVSIGVPITILFILPALDGYVVNGAIGDFFGKFSLLIMGVNGTTYHPVNWMIFCLITALLVEGISYLLIKEAVIKSK